MCRCRNAHVYADMHICIDEAGDFQEAAFPQDLSPLTLGLWLGQLSEDPSACPRAVAPDLSSLPQVLLGKTARRGKAGYGRSSGGRVALCHLGWESGLGV